MDIDTINNNDLPRLTTQELIDIYNNRKNDTDTVWGLIMMRATIYERVMRENSSLLLLLRDCARLIESPGTMGKQEREEIKERIHEFTAQHGED